MPKLFGTDGIRGVANRDLTPDLALVVGRAAGRVLGGAGKAIVVGRDTRMSGPMLEAALVAGLCSSGTNVLTSGIVPTPAIAFLTLQERAAGGAVVSASHNPVDDNGIKFFSSDGTKTSAAAESDIESQMEAESELPVGDGVGSANSVRDPEDRYIEHVVGAIDGSLDGLSVVLDCAFGAAYSVGPQAFERAGATVSAINAAPDGSRINVDCGSTSLEGLRNAVLEKGAALGLAFDGDADRVLAVDEKGEIVDGDRIVAMCALDLSSRQELTNDVVVATVMANLGFHRFLKGHGIDVIAAPVGDKFVAEAMADSGAVLGGEQSGHVIFAAHSTTGDGVLTGLKVARLVASSGEQLSTLAHAYEPFPQVLINVPVKDRASLETADDIWEQVRSVQARLGDDGRVLVRSSGTEPLVRVMVEAADESAASQAAGQLADAVRERLA
ncbi:MAG: phosphoglucosamine mutase [Actinomycetota bacterium]|nr:phosphoglucosamine mutase [Actinomycetota bacterium]